MKDIVGEELLLSASEKLIQVSELFRTQISFRLPVVAYDQMFPFLFPEIHKDKADEIQVSFDKYKVCYSQTGFTIISFSLSSTFKLI
jgi:hypothetical protein